MSTRIDFSQCAVSEDTYRKRVTCYGWSHERAFTERLADPEDGRIRPTGREPLTDDQRRVAAAMRAWKR